MRYGKNQASQKKIVESYERLMQFEINSYITFIISYMIIRMYYKLYDFQVNSKLQI